MSISQRKNDTEVTLKISSNVADHSNDENNFIHKLLLTYKQVSKLRRAFANGQNYQKTQLHKVG